MIIPHHVHTFVDKRPRHPFFVLSLISLIVFLRFLFFFSPFLYSFSCYCSFLVFFFLYVDIDTIYGSTYRLTAYGLSILLVCQERKKIFTERDAKDFATKSSLQNLLD